MRDDTDRTVVLPKPPRRIVSLVPSLTETLFTLGCGDAVVGVTRYCAEPAVAVATRVKVGGTKNPDVAAIRALGPDLVIVNAEENRREDVADLEQQGVRVFVSFPASLADTVDLLRRLGELTGCVARGCELADELAIALAEVRGSVRTRRRVFCPIWKNPWMTVGGGTYVDDVLWTCGGANVFRDHATRYPEIALAEAVARAPEVLLLPDEPYHFSPRDLPDLAAFDGGAHRFHFVDGKALSWYGPRAAAAVRSLAALLR